MSKSVYVRVVRDLELLRYVLRCAIERELEFPTGINKVYCYCSVNVVLKETVGGSIGVVAGRFGPSSQLSQLILVKETDLDL